MNDTPSNLESSLSSREKQVFVLICVLFLLTITLPYLWTATTVPPGYAYGGLLYNVDDQNVHLAWMRQAHDGAFFIRDVFTGESLDARPYFVNLFALVLGGLSRVTTLPLLFWYHAARITFAALTLWWLLRLVSCWTQSSRIRVLTIALAAFSSGAGWLAFLLPARTFIDRADGVTPHSPSLMMPEAWTFASALIFPLNIAGIGFIAFVLWQSTLAVRGGGKKPLVLGILAFAVLTNIHTYDAIPLGLLLLAWTCMNLWVAKPRDPVPLAPFFVSFGALPPLLYQVWVFRNSPEFQQKALTPTLPPPILDLGLSYAFLLVLAAAGIWAARSKKVEATVWLPILWLGTVILCIYAPVSFARKMIEGAHLPLCFLAAVGIAHLLRRLTGGALRAAAVGVIALLSISSLQFASWCIANAAENNSSRATYFMPPVSLAVDDGAALRLLDDSGAGRDGLVLSLPYLSNYVPRETGRTVYAGHWAETLGYWDDKTHTGKLAEVQRFYGLGRSMTSQEAREWLRRNKIRFVIEGSYEHAWMAQMNGKLSLDLPVWNKTGSTTIYSVPDKP